MEFLTENLLTILIVLPIIGAMITLLLGRQESNLKWVTLGVTLVNFFV